MRSPYMRHHDYAASDQKMSLRGMTTWRSRNYKTGTFIYNMYTDDGEFFRGTRTVFKAKVRQDGEYSR